ncbi:MAG: hypothetical protein ACOH1P_11895 [Lysobacter sp.]
MNRNHFLPMAILGCMALASSVAACAAGAQHGFVPGPGFVEVDAEVLDGEAYYSAERFPRMAESAFMPDADLAAPVRALLLVESREGLLPHARYRVTYQLTSTADDPDLTRSYVEVTRFNLGPAFRESLVDSVPAEHLAGPEEFGVGPDVSWRFEMSSMRAMTAGIDRASRKELSAVEAAAMDCLGVPCNVLAYAEGPQGAWTPQEVPSLPVKYRVSNDDSPAPARVVEELLAVMGEDAQQPTEFVAGSPRLVFVVSANADGQDLMTTALARNSVVFDDEIGTMWIRSLQVPDLPVDLSVLMQARQ